MPALTFRFKLGLAMVLVVAGASAATLLIVQRRLQAYYQANFRAQFNDQIAYFLSLQDARLGAVKEECLALSHKVRIVAAMSEQEIPSQILYDVTDDELKALLGDIQEDGQADFFSPSKVQATFFRYLDANGKAVAPPEGASSRLGFSLDRSELEHKLLKIRGAIQSGERQQIGYLSLRAAVNPRLAARANPTDESKSTNAPTIQEVVVTKVVEPDKNQALGALVLGFPLPKPVPQQKLQAVAPLVPQVDAIQSGILLENRFYADTNAISAQSGGLLASNISQRITTTQKLEDDFEWQIGNSPFRVFYRLLNPGSDFPPSYQVCLYSMAEARREQMKLRRQVLGSSGVALVGALVVSLVLSHGLSVPVRELVSATHEIRRGNLSVKVRIRSRDEMGQLAESFNEMTEGLAQKERYRTVLNQVADERVAQQLLSGEITLGGEERRVSVLFCDIRGFTALTEQMPPAEIIEMLNEHMTALMRVVNEHNGVLDKFVGDLLMAIFGAPVGHQDDVMDAARCALGLIQERQHLNQISRHKLVVGLGLATGKVVAGGMGSANRFHYTVLGERVNLASRLCDCASPGEVLIDETTYTSLEGRIVAEPVPAIPLKGFADPVPAYKLLTIHADALNS